MASRTGTGKGKSGGKAAAAGRKGLARYREKRDFQRTPEPPGTEPAGAGDLYIVQKHAATRLHYDLRLQLGGVLKSWAVARGPSLDPKVKRLAVHVEDHPVDYGTFEGLIPKGEYGGGAVIVWDRGTWVPMSDPEEALAKGTLKFRLAGEKLGGGWSLVRLKGGEGAGRDWLLIKERDIFARPESEGDVVEEQPLSVLSGRSIEDIAHESDTGGKRGRGRRRAAPKPARIGGAVRRPLGKPPPPQLASSADAPPSGPGWVHEIKHDGYRTLCRLADGEARLFTRGGHDWTERYGPIAEALTRLPVKSAIVDGEICVQDPRGLSSFPALQDALATGAAERLVLFAFDLLHLDGYDLTGALLIDRKATLAALLEPVADETFPIQYSDHVVGHGAEFFAQAVEMSMEGIISKKADAAYHPGRSKSWLKVKRMRSGEFVIVGYGESDTAGEVAALALAERSGDELRYVGKVGTGFSAGEAARLRRKLTSLERRRPPMPLPQGVKPRDARWVRPKLLADVEYATRTGDGALRHAVYRGLREDVSVPAAQSARPRRRYVSDADLAAVWVTNPDRVMFGKGGPSKLDLVLYHARVGDWMLPELLGRPLTLVRCPTGKVEDNFYQRHALAGMPAEIKGISMREEGSRERADFLYIDDAKGLFFLAQFGVIEFHPWGCRIDKPERPDRLIFDLDPDERLDWLDVIDAALQLREELSALGFETFVRTTGGKGLHIVVPVERRHTWAVHKAFAHAFVQRMARRWPRRYTASPARHHRKDRIFIDYIRNVRGATAVGSYSLRARPGVPVATPLEWSELRDVEDPAELNYATVPDRLAGLERDPWQDIDRAARPITKEAQGKIGN